MTPLRGDLADVALAGRYFVPHYAEPLKRWLVVPFAALRAAPREEAEAVSELLAGESFRVLDIGGAWVWGACAHDCYVGYLRLACLGETGSSAALQLPGDPVAAARSFLGRPFVPGGRGGAGFDSAGLVQRAFAGFRLPRDWDQQAVGAGRLLSEGDDLQAGDLLFREGLSAIYAGSGRVILADAQAGAVIERPLEGFGQMSARRVLE